MNKTILVDVDGYIFVKDSDTSWMTPHVIHRLFPTGLKTREIVENYGSDILGAECPFDRHERMFVIPKKGYRQPIGIRTIGDANVTEEAVLPPKVRSGTEVRWYNGEWEKYNKKLGWVKA